MSIRLTGQLLSPTDGSPAANGQIRFISLQGTGKVPKGAIAIEAADVNGDYDFTLEFGRFSVEIRQADKFVKQGAVSVNADTPTPLEVGELLEYTEPLTPGQITYVEQLTAQAEAAAQAANVSQSASNSSAMAASNSAAEAKSEADRASEIAGLDTVEEAIDLTLAKTLGLMTETEAMAQTDAYEQMFAASGMVHMGKHRDNSSSLRAVNEGMYLLSSTENTVRMGVLPTTSSISGESKTDFPVTYIAGAIANILDLNAPTSTNATAQFELPQAEAGTRVYDSTGDVRGSGQATLDFRYDNDPKYGGAPSGTEAEILREGVSRAFEGYCVNGDFRLGDSGDWFLTGSASIVTGIATVPVSSSMWRTSPIAYVDGEDYEVEVYAESVVGAPLFRHTTFKNDSVLTEGLNKFTFTFNSAQDVNPRYQVLTTANDSCSVTSVSVRKVTEEVVTHRSDVATWESYDEELTGRKEIMECIQSLSTTFGDTDVPTVLSTRPLSYFQQYDGQFADPDIQNDRYRCVVWDDLTDEQKRKVAAYMGNKLYVGENGNLVNRRLRARTFRGAGNGDWENIDVTHKGASWDQFLSFTTSHGGVRPQGSSDSSQAYSNTSGDTYATTSLQETNNDVAHKGAFAVWSKTDQAYKGRCFLYVVASVPRANQGFYHPNLNPWGTASVEESGYGFLNWSHSRLPSDFITTLKDCFYKVEGVYTCPSGGDIAGGSGRNGHPDGIFYDGITAGGLNGVIDWRLPAEANDSPEEQAKVQGKVENKTFRGLEKLVWTHVQTASQGATSGNTSAFDGLDTSLISVGDTAYLENYSGIYEKVTVTQSLSNGTISFSPTISGRKADSKVVLATELNLSVSGEFSTQMVIGDPANLVQVDALKDGWLGTWCDAIPNGTSQFFEATRKCVSYTANNAVFTMDNGATWSVQGFGIDSVTNGLQVALPTNRINIVHYTAYAKVTEPCENKPVYNGKKGLMGVVQFSDYRAGVGALFAESLLGKVLKNTSGRKYVTGSLISFDMWEDGVLQATSGFEPAHSPLILDKPTNNSPAVKALTYQIAENEQCFIGYQANELTAADFPLNRVNWTGATRSISTGAIYHISAPVPIQGMVIIAKVDSASFDLSNIVYDESQDKFINAGSGTAIDDLAVYTGSQIVWGDDAKIKLTVDGSDTFVDLNGKINLSVSHKTTMPTGWTKNRARIGEQVLGIDL